MAKITTLLFDCDNTLVLSEDLAFEGCADLVNEICQEKGVRPLPNFTGATLISEFVGQNFRGMLASLQARYGFPLTADEIEAYVRREEDVVIARLQSGLSPCVGVEAQLESLAAPAAGTDSKSRLLLAVVSSSALRRVRASLQAVGFDRFFAHDHVFSAATSLPTPTSKPDPAIYLHAMRELGNLQPSECVAIEDSRSGTLSAHRAGIPVIGYVGPYETAEKRAEMTRVLREAGAGPIMEHWSEFPACLAKLEKGE